MSRTIRRKSISNPCWLFWDWVFVNNTSVKVYLDRNCHESRKRIAKYRSDSATFMGSAPHYFCNFFERSARQNARYQLHMFKRWSNYINTDTEYPVIIDANHRHNATWQWW
jgi:hypothetical protein